MNTKIIPFEIQERFFNLFEGTLSRHDFEQWLYTDVLLESLVKHVYLDLIALDFKSRNFNEEVLELITGYLDYPECDRRKLMKILQSLIALDDTYPESLKIIYDVSFGGYEFLSALDTVYGLAIEDGLYYQRAEWKTKSGPERVQRVSVFQDGIRREAEAILAKLERDEITLPGHLSKPGSHLLILPG